MKTVDDLEVSGRRVLVRADLNVPIGGDDIRDDGKIRASLPTLGLFSASTIPVRGRNNLIKEML
jgi:3-phosphoglycerate kinase